MIFVSLTRLRIRSIRFVPLFFLHTIGANRQIRTSPGFRSGGLLQDRKWIFWTMTAWDSQDDMRAYITSGSHKKAMLHLLDWCDEASVAHWAQPDSALPTWEEADRRMRETGRVSKVRHPSPNHASMTYQAPRTTRGAPITPA